MLPLCVLLSFFAIASAKDNIICPDGKSMCFESQTCCIMASGKYGCCPLPKAVCCSDNVHCCPTSYKCNLQTMTCNREGREIPMLEHEVARAISDNENGTRKQSSSFHSSVGNVMCPGGRDYCADGNTCCLIGKEEYACCPMVEAVCCNDHVHCCPNGYTCNIGSGGCQRKGDIVPLKTKTPAKKVVFDSVECSHGKSDCPDGNTCCPVDEGIYGCCPMPRAVCCSDNEHCCPHGFKCDVKESRCTIGGFSVPMLKKIRPLAKENMSNKETLSNLIPSSLKLQGPKLFCPDHKSSCPEEFTCCLTKSGFWGCCPLRKATCCSDGEHCCPEGSKCDVATMKCTSTVDGVITTWVRKQKAAKIKDDVSFVVCPDGTSHCPTGYTCCLLSSGMYGCCPYANAVCCNDHIHCCPQGTTCDVRSGMCLRGIASVVKLQNKQPNYLIQMMSSDDVVCPDKVSLCSSGSTCCKSSTGSYACCPLPKAVCCSDEKHCCPHATTCDLSSGRCLQGNAYTTMMKKVAAKPLAENVICPDGVSTCSSGYTCCKLSTGSYGCCPLPKAVCCSDGKHCCPHATTCDLSSGRCLQGNAYTTMMKKVAAKPLPENVICPDGVSTCSSGYTCCKLSTGGYGCCPLPNAVCCSDGKHCCPHGTTCDLSSGRCLKGNAYTTMMKKVAAKPLAENVICPDGVSTCSSGYTCCKLSTGSYGCCPLPKAVCCSDGKHCCPHGTTCDLSSGRCLQGNAYTTMMKKVAAKPLAENVICPDGESSCPSGSTCCKLSTGGYGCCPLPNAVCCSDGKHCCPHGTTCDLSSGRCLKGNAYTTMMKKVAAKPLAENVICPDGVSTCSSGYTCCKLSTGSYGCCPLPKAVCCSDGKHCCPHGTTCDLSSGRCLKGNAYTTMMKKVAAKPLAENVICPDGVSTCSSGYTCCKLSTGSYGCCPLPKAVCCSDGKHCCPHGTTCDLSSGRCLQGNAYTTMMKKVAAKPLAENVICPDGVSTCSSGYTCCKLSTGSYGCCPLPKAVCCSDGKHCCPHGTTCDLSSGRCLQGNAYTTMMKKVAAKPLAENVICPDGESSCPSGSTCCKLSTGGYGCCPLPNAVCCSDGKHCCPHGTTCDLSSGRCLKGNAYTTMMKKVAAKPLAENVICPDGVSTCSSGYTCCKLSTGSYGCCPLPNAVCCSDGKHCCPHGTTCDLSSGRCLQGNAYTTMMKKVAAKPLAENVICPDGESSCPSGSTCCKLSTGGYGCCPLPKAVCCSDGKHCCPHGTTCDLSSGRCLKGNAYTTMMKKVAAKPLAENVICPDGVSTCSSGYTCCKLSTGSYGCCPLPKAVCCSDGKHCCPHGTTCDLSSGRCLKGNAYTTMMKKVAAKPLAENVICPDGESSCPSGSTCCKLSTGGYGCCPLPNAVCCSDGKHCCPHGTTCDLSSGRCLKGNAYTTMMKKVAAKPLAENVICPDGESSCPSGSTCCKLSTGGYGCCPLPKAVCCSDGKHCCPHGTTCDLSSGRCLKGNAYTTMMKKVAAKPLAENVICPDGESSCPSGSTCCKLSTGGYGCCPLPNAVCCSDGKHCCPHGTTCDLSSGRCLKGNAYTTMMKKVAAKPLAENVICPDGESSCPSGSTCCKLSTGGYGCCPLPKAVCCSDGKHCCPRGTTCDLSSGRCLKGNAYTTMMKKVAAKPLAENVICPDGESSCPSGSTCCKLSTGGYGCCPLPNAVCCSDHVHCCPSGYSCSSGFCTKNGVTVKALRKIAAIKSKELIRPKERRFITCPDQQTVCVVGTTCCKDTEKESFSCCPIKNAICCEDHIHCCPDGWKCDVEQGTCRHNNKMIEIPLLRKLPGKKISAEKKEPAQDPYIRF